MALCASCQPLNPGPHLVRPVPPAKHPNPLPTPTATVPLPQVCLDFHFAVEQRARGFLRTFYGFNGTAGVWRLEAIEGSGERVGGGGWVERRGADGLGVGQASLRPGRFFTT